MKAKAIVITLVALGLAWTSTSWYTGKKIEDWYRVETEKINVRIKEGGFPFDISFAVASYERGVFSSTAHVALRLPQHCGLPKEVILIDTLDHGPFPWSQIKQGNLRPALLTSHAVLQEDASTKPWFEAAKGETPVDIVRTVSFSRDVLGQMVLAPLTIKTESASIKTSSAHFDIFISNDGGAYNGTGSMGFLEMGETYAHARGDFKLEGISIKYDVAQHGNFSQFLSQSDLMIKTTKVSINSMPLLSISDMAEISALSKKDQKFVLHLTTTVGAWNILGVSMPNINSVFEASSINITAWNALNTLYYDWSYCSPDSADDDMFPPLSAEQKKTLNSALKDLLADKPSFTWSPFEFKNQNGEIRLDVATILSKPEGIPAEREKIFAGFVHSLNGKLVVSKPLLEGLGYEILKKINPLSFDDASAKEAAMKLVEKLSRKALASGFFSLDNGKLTSTLNYDKGVLNINGKTVTPEDLANLRSITGEKIKKPLF